MSTARYLLFLTLLAPVMAWANCVTTTPTVSLGSTSSLNLLTANQLGSGSGGIQCTGVLGLLSTNFIRVTLSTAPTLTRGAWQIPLEVYTDIGRTTRLQPGQPVVLSNVPLLTLGVAGGGYIPLYFRTPTGVNVPAGTYTANVVLTWQYAVCTGIGVLGLCSAWTRSPGAALPVCVLVCAPPTAWGAGVVSSVAVNLTLDKSCVIGTADMTLDFGSRALVRQFAPVSRSFTVTCSNTEGYTVGFDNGQAYQASWRRMSSGSNRLAYNLYFPDTGAVWTTAQTLPMVGNGQPQSVTFQGIVDSTQNNVPVGIYTDNVTLVIMY